MTRFRDLLIFALCILLALAPVASANSGPSWWEGTTAAGMTVTGEDCPILVDHEALTFDIGEFPLEYYEDESAFVDYSAHVTAEYTFRNPTDAEVTVKLRFPFGIAPQYAPGGRMLPREYAVTADGAPVETVLRHSLVWGSAFVMTADSARLHDDYMEHPFYFPEMPVTRYVFRPEGVQWEDEHDTIRAKVRLDSDPAERKYILSPANSFSTENDHALAGSALRQGAVAELYVIGEPLKESMSWTLFRGSEQIEGTMEQVDVQSITLKDFLLSSRPQNAEVSGVDWYNAAVQLLDRVECGYGYLDAGVGMELMSWYEYELTIPAGQTLVNTVTAPVYPDIHTGWDPEIYTYEYLLSPAKGWADFGTLDIHIKTPYYLTECNLDGFEMSGDGYMLHLEELPDKELIFVLSSSAKPARPGTHGMRTVWLIAALGLALILGLISRRWRK